jgi:hypothetical protein
MTPCAFPKTARDCVLRLPMSRSRNGKLFIAQIANSMANSAKSNLERGCFLSIQTEPLSKKADF